MKRIPRWVFRGGALILAMIWAGFFFIPPAGAQPDPSPSPDRPDLTLAMRADNPVAGSGRIRLSIDIENQDPAWPPLLWLRLIVPPNNMTIVQPQLDSGEVQFINADSTSSTYEIPAPANPAQQVRTFTVLLDLWPGPASTPNDVMAELSLPDGPLLMLETLPAVEAAKLGQARPTVAPPATETVAAETGSAEEAGSPATNRPEETSTAPEAATPAAGANEIPAAQAQATPASATAGVSEPLPTVTVPPAAASSPSPTPAGGGLFTFRSGWILVLIFGGLILLGGLVLALVVVRALRRRNAPPKVALRPKPVNQPEAAQAGVSAVAAAATTATQKVEPVVQKAYLQLLSAPGGAFPLGPERVTIGRAEGNQILLPADVAGRETLSRFHAAIYWQNGNHVIEDLDSHNGITVNGRATPKNELQDGDRLQLGNVECQYHRGEPDGQQGENRP